MIYRKEQEKPYSNIVVYLFAFIICILVILILLKGIAGRYLSTKLNRIEGIVEHYRTVNLRASKNILSYTLNSRGGAVAALLSISEISNSGQPSYFSNSIGTSYYQIYMPIDTVANTVDTVVNELGFFRKRKIRDPMLTIDIVKTIDFLDFWVTGKNNYGPTFNPDTYVTGSVYGYDNDTVLSVPPALEFSYIGTCAATGLSTRNMWQGYVVDIENGTPLVFQNETVPVYLLTVQGPKNIPLSYYQSYLYKHPEPTESSPHFHLAPRIRNVIIQNLNSASTEYGFFSIKITRTTTPGTCIQGPENIILPQEGIGEIVTVQEKPSSNPTSPAPSLTDGETEDEEAYEEEETGDLADTSVKEAGEAAGEAAGGESAGEIVAEVFGTLLCSIS